MFLLCFCVFKYFCVCVCCDYPAHALSQNINIVDNHNEQAFVFLQTFNYASKLRTHSLLILPM